MRISGFLTDNAMSAAEEPCQDQAVIHTLRRVWGFVVPVRMFPRFPELRSSEIANSKNPVPGRR